MIVKYCPRKMTFSGGCTASSGQLLVTHRLLKQGGPKLILVLRQSAHGQLGRRDGESVVDRCITLGKHGWGTAECPDENVKSQLTDLHTMMSVCQSVRKRKVQSVCVQISRLR